MSQPMNCTVVLVCLITIAASGAFCAAPRQVDTYGPSVPARGQSRTLSAEMEDDVLDAKIEPSRQEGRCEDQATDLHLEPIGRPGILVHHQAAAVSNGFKSTSYCDNCCEGADFGLYSYGDLAEEA